MQADFQARSALTTSFSQEMAYVHKVLASAKFADYMQATIAELRDVCAEQGPHSARADVLERWRQRKIYWRVRKFFMMQERVVAEPDGVFAATGDFCPDQPDNLLKFDHATKAKLAALAFCLHFFLEEKHGAHQVWVLDLPEKFTNWPSRQFPSANFSQISSCLMATDFRFSPTQREHLAQAVQFAAAYSEKAHAILASSKPGNKGWEIVNRWFCDANTTEEMMVSHVAKMQSGLHKMIALLRSNKIVLTDHPQLRGKVELREDVKLLNSEAFVFTKNDPVAAIYIQQRFFSENPVIKGPLNFARIIIHEVSHKAVGTVDVYYASNGIRPSTSRLPHNEIIKNCDSWAFCILELAGVLTDFEIDRALIN